MFHVPSKDVDTQISLPIFMPALALGEGLIAALVILNILERVTKPAHAARNVLNRWYQCFEKILFAIPPQPTWTG